MIRETNKYLDQDKLKFQQLYRLAKALIPGSTQLSSKLPEYDPFSAWLMPFHQTMPQTNPGQK